MHLVGVGVLFAASFAALAPASASAASTKPKVLSGTITYAEAPSAPPNYIFPFMGCAYFSTANIAQFQELMYRPLYWFGLGGSTAVQYQLSPANPPIPSGNRRQVTIGLKGWKYSDGQTVDAASVAFFLNLYKADPGTYCGYNVGYGIPDQLTGVSYPGGLSGSSVILTFSAPMNLNWLLYNYLSEITPMPSAWDKTTAGGAAGSGGCETATWGSGAAHTKCLAVEGFLDGQAANGATYTSAMWQTVDGPWTLSSFDASGDATFVPNPSYAGPQKPQVAKFDELAYTTTAAEEDALYKHKVQLGYIDTSVLPSEAPAPGKVGANVPALAPYFHLQSGEVWGFNYLVINFAASDPKLAALRQLYVRQALQGAINQLAIVRSVDKGYGWPQCSPLPPVVPKSLAGRVSCPYPYSRVKAKERLAAHGWKIMHGVQTCESPGIGPSDCGASIANGYQLKLQLLNPGNSPELGATLATEASMWGTIGIQVQTFFSEFAGCSGGNFQLCTWGGGWIYEPDVYPSGETLFTPGGAFNLGAYADPTMTALIEQTVSGTANLNAYANYAAQQIPVLYQPNFAPTVEVSVALKGITVQNPLGDLLPEYLHY